MDDFNKEMLEQGRISVAKALTKFFIEIVQEEKIPEECDTITIFEEGDKKKPEN